MVKKKVDRLDLIPRLLPVILAVFILSTPVLAQLGCTVTLDIDDDTIYPGDDNSFQVTLTGASCGQIPVTIEVTDPFGVKHEYREITPSAAPWTTSSVSYLEKFDNTPTTDIIGRFYVVASCPDDWTEGDFVIMPTGCENATNDSGDFMAERQLTIESIPEIKQADVVTCCDFDCCYDLALDLDCAFIAGNFPVAAELTVGTLDPNTFGWTTICQRLLVGTTIEYSSINSSKYALIGREVGDTNITYWFVDKSKDGCILADTTSCLLVQKRLLIDRTVYKNYVLSNLSRRDALCMGFYVPSIDWPYNTVQNTSRYLDIYGNLTDFLYCHLAPNLISESRWCHFINLGWYSVVTLENQRDVTYITPENIDLENQWDNLSGYIVLGHACPLYRWDTTKATTSVNDCFDATAAPFSFICPSPPCIYVWDAKPLFGSFGYREEFCRDGLPANPNLPITLKVADSETDTQIPDLDLIREEIESIESNITIDMSDSGCNNVQDNDAFYYVPPYRCANWDDVCYYRLFDQDTMWVKVFTVTPLLEDERLYWNWSRTSPPDDKVNVTIYIGGGCKRTSAFTFNYSDAVHSYYETPIIDYVNVTVHDGQNPPIVYNVSGWNLLPFPPADSVTNPLNGNLVELHPYEGVRYSYFAINHTVPENAAYLNISVNYTCEATLRRNLSAYCAVDPGLCWIHDKSTVKDNFILEFLEHENPKDNCKWDNPIVWRNISGSWERIWDAALDKHILHLKSDTITNRRWVSVDPVDDGKTMLLLVKGDALGGDIADITIGFYSDENADNYWFLDLHQDANANMVIGVCNPICTDKAVASPPVIIGDNIWYGVRIYLSNGNIFARVWDYSVPEPVNWQISYDISSGPPFAIYGNHLVIGTEGGANNEEFWFDPDPECGIEISGYYDHAFLPTGQSYVTGGFLEVKTKPDILSGITVSVNNSPRVEYEHMAHPAKHLLYRKEKGAPPSYPETQEFYRDDKYGYESVNFGFNEKCKSPICPPNCYCTYGSIFSPECIDVSKESSEPYHPQDCVCAQSECYPDPCTSDRTYHEFEGIYYDFVDFYNELLPIKENYFRTLSGTGARLIGAKDMTVSLDVNSFNSPESTYQFYFTCQGINETDFRDYGVINVYTHFRNYTYYLKDVITVRTKSNITYDVNPPPEVIEPGDLVNVTLTLWCGVAKNPNKPVEVTVVNYEDSLAGVNWVEDKAYVITDADGKASFTFVIRKDTAEVTLSYDGDLECSETKVIFLLGGEVVSSPVTSVEFVLLIIIFFLAVFSYRFFKKGRLDLYEMWQELKGEKD